MGDFDADGDADLAVRDESDSLKIFLKTNGLQITRESLVARVDGLRGVAAGDLDNDGDLDLVAAALDDAAAPRASIQVFANAGRGRFLAGESQAVDSLAVDLVLSDLDRDGALDIVFGPELGYLRGHGDGTFDGPSRIDAGNRDGANLHAADFDGDGYPDLLVTRSRTGDDLATEVFVLFNESSAARPRFRSAVSVRRRAAPDALLTDLAVADMDADGNPDILVGWTCPSCAIMGRPAEILLSDGQGRFAGGDPVEFGLFQFPQFFPGDVDGDGDQDVVVQTAGHAFLSYENLGDGTFVRVGRTLFARERPFQIPAALADFDGNGDLELVDLSSGVVEFYDILGRPPLRDANRDGVPDDCETFRRGDANADGRVNVTDAVTTLIELFARRGAVKCFDGADVNDDGALDITDAIRTLEIVFTGDLPVPPPGALACGPDPSVDALPLCTYPRELCRN